MKTFAHSAKIASAAILFGVMFNAHSAITDLATAPLITSPTSSVLPNVFLMLDDSGSMGWSYMPDNAGNFNSPAYGGASSQCNGVFYDPTISYSPPVDSTGAAYANSSFTAAWDNGYNTGGGSTNLSTSFVPAGGGTAQPAYYYKYVGTQTTEKLKDYYNTGSPFYTECNATASSSSFTVGGSGSTTVSSITVNGVQILSGTTAGNTSTSTVAAQIAANITLAGFHATVSGSTVTIWPPSLTAAGSTTTTTGYTPSLTKSGSMTMSPSAFPATKFLRVKVSATSGSGATDERTNFANWWSYYHTRILMMKTATGEAFSSIGPTFRVGFATINNNTNGVLGLATFDATQKASWYTKLYASTANNSTPLREALADVGRMYANKLPASNSNNGLTSSLTDPIQFSCQQNFVILTTDGFWNGSTTYNLAGGTVGNQDYFEPRPMYDGSSVTSTTTTPYTTVQQRQKDTTGVVTTNTWQKIDTTVGAACSTPGTPPNLMTVNADSGDGSHWVGVGTAGSNPDSSRCITIGTLNAYFCRGKGSHSSTPALNNANATDSGGTKWYLVSSLVGNTNSASCVSANSISGISSGTAYACPGGTGVAGSYVTTTPKTQQETISGSTSTSVDNYTANQSTTQTTSNGVVGPVSALTPSTLTYAFTNNVSASSTAPTSDVFGSWSNGTPSTTCVATASVPPPSLVWANPDHTTSSTAGTSTTTVLSTVGPTAGTPSTTGSSSGGTSNTLADVAEYYYITDLRTSALGNNLSGAAGVVNGSDISANNVPSSGLDKAVHQHMTTFTLGLGARGRMVFDPAYESATSGDFYAVKQGSTASSTAGICTWQANNTTCNWPTPASDAIENIDDLWHAAVNGRGTYFSAGNPTGLATALSSALAGVSARTGAAAAATTSNAFVTQGDNFLFRSTFVSQQWTGELIRQQLDITTGAVLSTVDWSAQSNLDANAARNIYFYDSASATKLSSFTLANLTTAGLNNYFSWAYISSTASPTLSQLCAVGATCLPSWVANTSYPAGSVCKNGTTWYKVNTAYTSGATWNLASVDTNNSSVSGVADTNLVNFIRGDRTYEGATTDLTKYYRQRNHVFGDIVNSETDYVKAALAPNYSDSGYPAKYISSVVTNGSATVTSTALFPSDVVGKWVTGTGIPASTVVTGWASASSITISNLATATATSKLLFSTMSDRQAMVYVGANDGMLHAFYAADDMMSSTTGHIVSTGGVNVTGGQEAWAFIPTAVIPNLYKLADKNYSLQHQYYVDGSPVTADICPTAPTTPCTASQWKTILVGGLNGGGKSYYALDITNPAQPKALWQFSDVNMGYTYGNPKVVKLKTGQWVVLMTSGYNNTSGDGKGYLYVVDAYTGALVTSVNGTGIIGTGVGDVATPSGLGRLDAPLVTPGVDSTATAVYAGDMLGNLWRFDINGDLGAAGYDAQLLATLKGAANNIQPITTKPLLSKVGGTLVVYVGTGRYLGSTDLPDLSRQSFYAIKDTFPTESAPGVPITPSVAIYGNPRAQGTFVNQSLTSTTCSVSAALTGVCSTGQSVVVSSSNTVAFASNGGWYLDFPLAGERVNTDPALIDRTLILNTNVPNASSCSVGGDSYQYQLNYSTGGAVSSSAAGVIAVKIGNELSTRAVIATLADGTNMAYTQGSGGGTPTASKAWKNELTGDPTKFNGPPTRKSWRQLIQR